jgi:hypothetical protein
MEAAMALRKLTLSIDESVIERAREYSERHQTSISRLVTSYLDALARTEPELAFSPAVRRLLGILPAEAGREEYRAHLEEKHSR